MDKMSDDIDQAISATFFSYRPEYAQIRSPALSIYAIKKNTYYIAPDYMTSEQKVEMIEYFDNVVQPWNYQSIEQFRREAPHAKVVEIPDGHHYCFIQQEDHCFQRDDVIFTGKFHETRVV